MLLLITQRLALNRILVLSPVLVSLQVLPGLPWIQDQDDLHQGFISLFR